MGTNKNNSNKNLLRMIFLFITLILILSSMEINLNLKNVNHIDGNTQKVENHSEDRENINHPKKSGYWVLSKIHIDDTATYESGSMTWATAAAQDWCSGQGTLVNPYIIENVTINGQATAFCIKIQDSTKYFIIRNCTLYNCTVFYWSGAIELQNTRNGKIISNNISNNYFGIMVETTSNNNLIANNTFKNHGHSGVFIAFNSDGNIVISNNFSGGARGISLYDPSSNSVGGNIVENNFINSTNSYGISFYHTGSGGNNIIRDNVITFGQYGINIDSNSDSNTISNNLIAYNNYSVWISTPDCSGNTFYHNNFTQNKYNAIDNGVNNNWHNGYIGNYWHNYTGTDPDDDGCGTLPYAIRGSAGKQDMHPFCDDGYNGGALYVDDSGYYSWNWEFSSTFSWVSGTGSLSDLYLIEDLIIDASDAHSGNGILIINSNSEYFKINNCTIYNSAESSYPTNVSAGIKLINVSKAQITFNNCSLNKQSGISLYSCKNITIDNNLVYGSNQEYGIFMRYTNESRILNNTADYNKHVGIFLQEQCHYNNITNNNASYNGNYYGIALYTNSDNNNIINNTANENGDHGIFLDNDCDGNNITYNTANGNGDDGIRLNNGCDGNRITNNNCTGNLYNGVGLYATSNDNVVANNILFKNWRGIFVNNCDRNNYMGNQISNSSDSELFLYNGCDDSNIIDNIITNSSIRAIILTTNCHRTTISNNFISNSVSYGIQITTNCCNSIICKNRFTNNPIAINVSTGTCDNTEIIGNIINGSTTALSDSGTGTTEAMNCIEGVCTPIIIDDIGAYSDSFTWEEAILYVPWFSGDGSQGNPYIIENIKVDAKGVGSGILISYSTVYFIIRYCNVNNSGDQFGDFKDAGINICNSVNGVLFNNTCNANRDGILIDTSNQITIANNTILNNRDNGIHLWNVAHNNLIANNTFYNNTAAGVRLHSNCDTNTITNNLFLNKSYGININSSDCGGNLIFNNRFLENTARDQGTTNNWNNTIIGNYWTQYGGIDANDNGIGDTAYNIDGTPQAQDHLPIWWDTPLITVISPENNQMFGIDSPSFEIEVARSNNYITWYRLWNSSYGYTENKTFTGLTGLINNTFWSKIGNGSLIITYFVNDTRGFETCVNISLNKNIYIPIITITTPTLKIFGLSTPNITIYNSSSTTIDKMLYSVYNGSVWSANRTIDDVWFVIDITVWDTVLNGSWILKVYLNDTSGNSDTDEKWFYKDIIAPYIFISSHINYSLVGKVSPTFTLSYLEGNYNRSWYFIWNGSQWSDKFLFSGTSVKIDQTAWINIVKNGTVILSFYANDIVDNENATDIILRVDIICPVVTITWPETDYRAGEYPPSYVLSIQEPNLIITSTSIYYSFDGGITKQYITKLSGDLDHDVWDTLAKGRLTLWFFVEDAIGNLGNNSVLIIKEVGAVNDDDDEKGDGKEEGLPFWLQAIIAGAISGSVGLSIRIAYAQLKKRREGVRSAEKIDELTKMAKDGMMKRKYKVEYLNFLTDYNKIEQSKFKVGVAQVGISTTGNLLTEYYDMDENHLVRIKKEKVDEMLNKVKEKIEEAHKNNANILVFPEMTTDLNYKKMLNEIQELAEKYKMYIITGGYHDVETKQNICVVLGPDGIRWEQEKHNPATINFGGKNFTEAIHIADLPHKIKVAETEYGRIAIAICRDFLDMDLRVELKNCEPPVDLVFNPAYSPVTSDFDAIHFDVRRSVYAYSFYTNVAEYGGAVVYSPEKDRTKRTLGPKQEGIIYKDVDLLMIRSERRRWEQERAKEKGFIQSTRE